ncbi:MAG TPA: hypothetical protein VD837_15120 [Terriglobales bacterium]|nr:hypothetical protein [Terriglobales bacterium]
MSTKVIGAYSDKWECLSSLEYLVSPLQSPSVRSTPDSSNRNEDRLRSDLNNSLQKLTNLVYLLSREAMDEEEKRTMLTLIQSEVAHLSVLSRRIGKPTTVRDQAEVTQ